jgi:YfiR/HmsC-like
VGLGGLNGAAPCHSGNTAKGFRESIRRCGGMDSAYQSARRRIVLIGCACLMFCHAPATIQAAPTPEYLIKAAYLYNFALFVEWPADAFKAANAPLVIGVVGTDPFDLALERTIQNKRINRRPLVVKHLQWTQDLKRCHILFVSSTESAKAKELATRLEGLPILLVGETPGFARQGGTINFTIKDNTVGFEVNVNAAKRSRLNISAKLLKLARIVRGG